MLTAARLLVVSAIASTVLSLAVPAMADTTDPVNCDPTTQSCDIDTGTGGGSTGGGGSGGTSGGVRVCKSTYEQNKVVPCWRDDIGWFGNDSCYYKRAQPTAQEVAWLGGENGKPGVWYNRTCLIPTNTPPQLEWITFLNDPPAPVTQLVAYHAVSRLQLPKLNVQASPVGTQLVKLPSWWWTSAASWTTQRATAAVPGVAVTATAVPYKAIWSPGDGSKDVVCTTAGSQWVQGTDPLASSPTCGHTYRRSSASAPGGAFQMTVRVVWRISWAGGGTSGAEPDLTTTVTMPVRVAESQTVIR